MYLERSRTISKHLFNLTFTRAMGGGPRTFPGGLNKWQWKRLHEKKAREKENKLLDQEKQMYQARVRSQIRAKLAGKPDQEQASSFNDSPQDSVHGPMSPKEHISALADRFMKEGAEDLWNEDDGPEKSPSSQSSSIMRSSRRPGLIGSPIDVHKLISENRHSSEHNNVNNERWMNTPASMREMHYTVHSQITFRKPVNERNSSLCSYDFMKPRHYSAQAGRRFRKNESSSSDDEADYGLESGIMVKDFVGNSRFSKSSSNANAKLTSSAALGKHDVKIKRRVPLKNYDEGEDFSEQVKLIKHELQKKSLMKNEMEMHSEETLLSEKRFDQCNISPLTVKALSEAGYVQMTKVQEATLEAATEGKDALVKAKTGTGKSAAFLLPAIEAVLKAKSTKSTQRVPPIDVLILCPTRELSSQIAAEAKVMVKHHDGIGVQTLIGGTRFKLDLQRLESEPCQIIVATPGRLLDHVENKTGFSVRLMGLKMLILDEADHLLDLGFRKDMEKIVDCLPRKRQSLLFSATVPKEVRRISQLVLKRDHVYIDTIGLGSVETPDKVKQSYIIAPHEQHFHVVYHLLKEHVSRVLDYKVIVFCTTAMLTSLMFLLLREMKMNVKEIHSRKPQLYRTRVSDEFKESKRLILVTSDVSARGMNYPDVTLVVQVGLPSDREQYIHRLGRTGREGKEGEGILLLAPWEEYFMDDMRNLPIEKSPLPQFDPNMKLKLDNSMATIDTSVKEAAYHAWLGYYNSVREIGRDKTTLVELANQFCTSIGLQNPPSMFRKTALKMGLKDIPGIRIRK